MIFIKLLIYYYLIYKLLNMENFNILLSGRYSPTPHKIPNLTINFKITVKMYIHYLVK